MIDTVFFIMNFFLFFWVLRFYVDFLFFCLLPYWPTCPTGYCLLPTATATA